MATPYQIEIPQEKLDWVAGRLRNHAWHHEATDSSWSLGPDPDWFRGLIGYWSAEYDWAETQARLNRLPHFTAKIDGGGGPLDIHFIHQRSPREDATPLLLVHGWPGSFLEFEELIPHLTDPDSNGAPGAPAFHVVVPSLPGYAFSAKPDRPIGPRAMAGYLARLMADELGYDRYTAQGGDWGSVICSWLGFEHDACRAIHLNMYALRATELVGDRPRPLPPQGDEELAWQRRAQKWVQVGGGYYHIQATKPETLAYAMNDSPVGVAAWIGEKFRTWIDRTSTEDGDPASAGRAGSAGSYESLDIVIGRDRLLSNILLYILTDSFNTAAWTYRGHSEEGSGLLPPGKRIEVPTGVAAFPREIVPFPPRRFVEQAYNVTHWTDMPKGGHFAAMEEPDLLLADVRRFGQSI
jgi:microsomal epoxide hydrolase